MGSCMSRRSGHGTYTYTTYKMEQKITEPSPVQSPKGGKRQTPYTRGQATSFGFKRRNPVSVKSMSKERTTALILTYQAGQATSSGNSQSSSVETSRTSSPCSSGRSTPRGGGTSAGRGRNTSGKVLGGSSNKFGFKGAPGLLSKNNKSRSTDSVNSETGVKGSSESLNSGGNYGNKSSNYGNRKTSSGVTGSKYGKKIVTSDRNCNIIIGGDSEKNISTTNSNKLTKDVSVNNKAPSDNAVKKVHFKKQSPNLNASHGRGSGKSKIGNANKISRPGNVEAADVSRGQKKAQVSAASGNSEKRPGHLPSALPLPTKFTLQTRQLPKLQIPQLVRADVTSPPPEDQMREPTQGSLTQSRKYSSLQFPNSSKECTEDMSKVTGTTSNEKLAQKGDLRVEDCGVEPMRTSTDSLPCGEEGSIANSAYSDIVSNNTDSDCGGHRVACDNRSSKESDCCSNNVESDIISSESLNNAECDSSNIVEDDSGLGTCDSDRVNKNVIEGDTDTLHEVEQMALSEVWLRDKLRSPSTQELTSREPMKLQSPASREKLTRDPLRLQSPTTWRASESREWSHSQSPTSQERLSYKKSQSPASQEGFSCKKSQSPAIQEGRSHNKLQSPLTQEGLSGNKTQSPVTQEGFQSSHSPSPTKEKQVHRRLRTLDLVVDEKSGCFQLKESDGSTGSSPDADSRSRSNGDKFTIPLKEKPVLPQGLVRQRAMMYQNFSQNGYKDSKSGWSPRGKAKVRSESLPEKLSSVNDKEFLRNESSPTPKHQKEPNSSHIDREIQEVSKRLYSCPEVGHKYSGTKQQRDKNMGDLAVRKRGENKAIKDKVEMPACDMAAKNVSEQIKVRLPIKETSVDDGTDSNTESLSRESSVSSHDQITRTSSALSHTLIPNSDSTLTVISPLDHSGNSFFSSTDNSSSRSEQTQVQGKSNQSKKQSVIVKSEEEIADTQLSRSSTEKPKSSNIDKMERSTNSGKDGGSLEVTCSMERSGTLSPAPTSSSETDQQDFLIDDEIADQPELIFDQSGIIDSSVHSEVHQGQEFEDIEVLRGHEDDVFTQGRPRPLSLGRINLLRSRTESCDTLSPCESLASDDLMVDFERSESVLDGLDDRYDDLPEDENSEVGVSPPPSFRPQLYLSGQQYDEEVKSPDAEKIFSEWSSLLSNHGTGNERLVHSRHSKLLRTRASSSPDVPYLPETRPRSFTGPLRPPRQMSLSEVEDGWVKIDRTTYQYACQDVLNFKTNLLKLKRILQEADTLNPFDVNAKNGLYWNLANMDFPAASIEENERGRKEKLSGEKMVDTEQQKLTSEEKCNSEEADLRRQVVFLQQELEERDRTVRLLQKQMTKYTSMNFVAEKEEKEMCNAATQTERLRPLSAGNVISRTSSVSDGLGPTVSSPEIHTAGERNQMECMKSSAQPRSCHVTKSKIVSGNGELTKESFNVVTSDVPSRHKEPRRGISSRLLSTGGS